MESLFFFFYRYIYFLFVGIFTPIRKVVAVIMFWAVVWFREPARNAVYNYILSNERWLKRLYERHPVSSETLWLLQSTRFELTGEVTKNDIRWITFQFWYWCVWIWVDDDSNYDTTDLGFLKKVASGEHYPVLGKPFRKYITKQVEYIESNVLFGNTFELGDLRGGKNAYLNFVCSTLWTLRNSAYNAKYFQFETNNEKLTFKSFTIFGYKFGWEKTEVVDGHQNYHMFFFDKVE